MRLRILVREGIEDRPWCCASFRAARHIGAGRSSRQRLVQKEVTTVGGGDEGQRHARFPAIKANPSTQTLARSARSCRYFAANVPACSLQSYGRHFSCLPQQKHSRQRCYQIETDSNYSNIFSIWDRIFALTLQQLISVACGMGWMDLMIARNRHCRHC